MCPSISPPNNGRFVNTFSRTYNSWVEVACDSGYEMTGSRFVQCREGEDSSCSGRWSSQVPTCRGKIKGNLVILALFDTIEKSSEKRKKLTSKSLVVNCLH